MSESRFFRGVFFSLLTLISISAVQAQSTIFNVPSTDVMGEKHILIEGDFITHFDKYENGGFQTYGYRMVYGVKRKFETGINFFYTRNGNKSSPKELQPNFKYKVYQNEKHGFAVSSGAQFFVPLNRGSGNKPFGMVYSNASKIIKRTGETRVTAGFYQTVGVSKDFGTKNGAIIGFEQPIKGKLSFTADWYSGKNRFGYSSAGLIYSFVKRQFVQVGYNFGNTGRGNNALSVFYGYTY